VKIGRVRISDCVPDHIVRLSIAAVTD
jgi:hypothetical protein